MFIKVDEHDKPLAGAEFGLFKNNADKFTKTEALQTAVSNKDGKFGFTGIPYGKYIVTELKAPEGYVFSSKKYEVNITEDKQVVKIKAVNNSFPLAVSKKDIYGNELSGAKMQILYSTGKIIDEWVSDGSDHVVSALIAGKYTLHESASPAGYVLAADIVFTIDKDNNVKVEKTDALTVDKNGNATITMIDDVTKVVIFKYDITGKRELPGARLQILDSNNTVVDEWVSDGKPHELNGKLTAGAGYKLHEVTAPAGYTIASDISFTVNADGNVTKVKMSDDTTKVRLSKKKITNNEELPGAKLQVLDKAGNVIDEWISTNEPHYIEGVLTAGKTYTLRETASPDGCVIAKDVEFTVNADGSVTEVIMVDDVTKVHITKYDITGEKEIAGAKLQVLDENKNVIDEWVSEETAHEINGLLTAGMKYNLHEVYAPDGYVVVTVYATHDINEIYSNDGGYIESGRYISNGDKCYVDHVYTSGLCHVQYPSNSTEPNRWAYCKASELPLTRGCSCSESYAGTYKVTTSQYPLTIRSGHGTSYEDIGKIPKGAHCTVTKADGSWAHVEYNGISGYASMEYLRKVNVDSEKPSISNVKISDVSVNGYTITCTVTDNVGIDRVQFPTWTLANDQDDIQPSWGDNPSARGTINGNTVTYRVNKSDHNNECGIYRTHIYAYDTSGNSNCVACEDVRVGWGEELKEGAGQTIPDGDYIIVSELGRRIYLDIPGVGFPADEGIDVAICEGSTLPDKSGIFDTWTVKYLGNGFYKIAQNEQCGKDRYLTISNESLAAGTELITYRWYGGSPQQWSIADCNHGYTIQSKSSSWYLDVRDGKTATGTKVQTCWENGGKAQSWCFIPVASDDKPIDDGEYHIKSACGDVYLDAYGHANTGDYKNGTNIDVAISNNDSFIITYVGDGYYTLCEATTGLAVEIEDSDKTTFLNRKNIQLGTYTGERQQLWRISDEGNGMYRFVSKLSGYSLDLAGMKTANGSNVQQHPYNTSNAQKWSFEKVHHHDYLSDITKSATCTEDGINTYTCSCGDTYTESIPATGHNYIKEIVEPTCTNAGYTKYTCEYCNDTYKEDTVQPKGHSYTNKITKIATCTEEGVTTFTCSCGDSFEYPIPANGHKYDTETISPTETDYGYDKHVCSECGDLYIDNLVHPITIIKNPIVSYKAGNSSVNISWSKVLGAENYAVYEYVDGKWQKLAEESGTSYTLNNLNIGTNYKVAVIAMFNGKWNKDFSNAIIVTPKPSSYPVVTSEVSGRQFRLKWTAVPGAEKYGIALYQSGKWRVKAQFAKNVTTFTSPKMKTGSYKMVVCAKVNGEWDTSSLSKRAFTVKIA